jgi:TRAP-type C4-dicarboxylate transport system permease small subunit
MTLLVSYDVLMRYFFGKPQLFVDDLSSFILVAVIFLGTGPTFYRGGHIRVDLVTNHLKANYQRHLRIITLCIGIALLGIITYETMISTVVAFNFGRVSAVMNYPLWIAMFFVPLGLIIMVFFMVVEIANEVRGKGKKEQKSPQDVSGEILH